MARLIGPDMDRQLPRVGNTDTPLRQLTLLERIALALTNLLN